MMSTAIVYGQTDMPAEKITTYLNDANDDDSKEEEVEDNLLQW